MREKAFVAGVGMVPFGKPGASDPYDVMAAAAVRKALDNAGLSYGAVQQAIRLCLRRLDLGATRALRGRHDRHPDRQRQQ